DPEQPSRSRHHRAFREADAVALMRQARLKPLRDGLLGQGVPAPQTETYIDQLMEDGAIEWALKLYPASCTAPADTPSVAIPTRYVWGTNDATVGRRAAELTREYVSGRYQFVEIEGGGHFVVDQVPERVSALLIEHIESVGSTPRE